MSTDLKNISLNNSVIVFFVFLSFILSLFAFYFSLEKKSSLSEEQKKEIYLISQQLRKIQQKELVLVAPIKTSVFIEKEIPLNQILPESLYVSINGTLPVNKSIMATNDKGQIFYIDLLEDVPISGSIPIYSIYAINESSIKLKQEIPIDSKFSLNFKVNVVYGQELNDIINRLENLSR